MKTISLEAGVQKYGVDEKDGKDVYRTIMGSKTAFVWDWRTIAAADGDSIGDNFLKDLDKMLAPHGLQIVKISFDGDCCPWTIEPKV